jgi:ribonucleotide monophosphatase NagD (HAD superfamily)
VRRTRGKKRSDKSTTPPPENLPGYSIEVMFDLDGTLAEATKPYHHIGGPIPEMVELVKSYVAKGTPCSIFTSRPESHRELIMEWLYSYGLHDLFYQVICDKPVFALLIDDRSWNPWLATIPASNSKSKKRS